MNSYFAKCAVHTLIQRTKPESTDMTSAMVTFGNRPEFDTLGTYEADRTFVEDLAAFVNQNRQICFIGPDLPVRNCGVLHFSSGLDGRLIWLSTWFAGLPSGIGGASCGRISRLHDVELGNLS